MKYLLRFFALILAFSIVLTLISCSADVGVGSDVPTVEGSSQKPTESVVPTVPTEPNPTENTTVPTEPTVPSQPTPTEPTEPKHTEPAPTEPTVPSQPTTTVPTEPAPTDPTATEPEPATEELNVLLDQILAKYGSSPRDIYDYVHDHFKYKYTRERSMVENALHLLEYGTGSCYNFAALTYYLFQRAGYEVYYVTGIGWQNNSYHCWVLAYFDEGWYYVDSLYVRSAKLTADDLRRIGYKWDEDAYPS